MDSDRFLRYLLAVVIVTGALAALAIIVVFLSLLF